MNTATKTGINAAIKFGDTYGKNLTDTARKQGTNFAKTAGKIIVQKSAEDTGDLIGNKIVDKTTLLDQKIKKKKMKQMKQKKLLFHQKRDNKLLMTLDCFRHSIKWSTKRLQTY